MKHITCARDVSSTSCLVITNNSFPILSCTSSLTHMPKDQLCLLMIPSSNAFEHNVIFGCWHTFMNDINAQVNNRVWTLIMLWHKTYFTYWAWWCSASVVAFGTVFWFNDWSLDLGLCGCQVTWYSSCY